MWNEVEVESSILFSKKKNSSAITIQTPENFNLLMHPRKTTKSLYRRKKFSICKVTSFRKTCIQFGTLYSSQKTLICQCIQNQFFLSCDVIKTQTNKNYKPHLNFKIKTLAQYLVHHIMWHNILKSEPILPTSIFFLMPTYLLILNFNSFESAVKVFDSTLAIGAAATTTSKNNTRRIILTSLLVLFFIFTCGPAISYEKKNYGKVFKSQSMNWFSFRKVQVFNLRKHLKNIKNHVWMIKP